jgi:hypothetical protein
MKKEKKETTIKELFQQLKREDEKQAPSFTDSLAAAQSLMTARSRASRARWPLAAVAAILIACGFIIFYAIRNGSDQSNSLVTERVTAPQLSSKGAAPAVENSAAEPARHSGLRPRRSRRGSKIRDDGITAERKESEKLTDFISLRYGDDNEAMESGDVIRVLMPRSALITLGLPVNVERADEAVIADLLIGEDGLARAIRFVQ